MSGHTPGPWSVFNHEDKNTRPGIEASDLSIVVWGYEKEDEYSGICGNTPEESEANARLIAAAPELLEALRVLAGIPLEEFGWERTPDRQITGWNKHMLYTRDVLAARAAIAKATGAA